MNTDNLLDESQWTAVRKLKTGSVLCGGTGSGKSRTSLAYYAYEVCAEYPVQLYVITTPKKRDSGDWETEAAPFDINAEDIIVDSWNNIGKYTDVKNAFFIFDEQRVVGKGTWVKSFLKICKKNDWILLSATPGDTYSDYIPLFIANGFYTCRTEFTRRHIVYKIGPSYPVIDRYVDTKILDHYIKEIVVPLVYSPDAFKIYTNVHCEYDKELYKKTCRDSWNYIDDVPIDTAADHCIQLRRICNSDPSRITALLGVISDNPKCIIFYSFDYELELITKAFDEHKIVYAQWNGHKHEPIPLESEQWCYLVQYMSGAEGWNCIDTNVVIFYSLQYSYKIFEQACGRIDRRNTPYKKLYYYILRSNASIDLHIHKCLLNKQDFQINNIKTVLKKVI